eukprot:223602_1
MITPWVSSLPHLHLPLAPSWPVVFLHHPAIILYGALAFSTCYFTVRERESARKEHRHRLEHERQKLSRLQQTIQTSEKQLHNESKRRKGDFLVCEEEGKRLQSGIRKKKLELEETTNKIEQQIACCSQKE